VTSRASRPKHGQLKDRKFIEVNPDNFDSVLAGMKPHLAFSVDNKLSDEADAGQLKVDLKLQELAGLQPDRWPGR